MKKAAIIKAQRRLDKARKALENVAHSTNHDDFESAWTDLLISLNTIMTVLEKGAKDSPQSRQWFGGKKKEVRTDPLLRYLVQARNADEHGLEKVSEHVPASLSVGRGNRFVHIEYVKFDHLGRMSAKFTALDGRPLDVTHTLPHAALVAVSDDRFGDTFAPPNEHLGQSIDDPSPYWAGEKAVAYYQALITEAAQRAA